MAEQRKSGDRKHSWQEVSEAERQGKFAQAGKQRSSPHIIPSIADSPALPGLRSSSKTALTTPPSPRSPKSPGTFEEFVPRRVLQWYIRNTSTAVREPKIVPIRAVVAFLDVSGFTPMTEKLSQRGPEGAEMVCTILSEYFTTLLEVVFSWGGDVIKFAGDALLVCFRLPDTPTPAEDVKVAQYAIQCALEAAAIEFERQGVPLHLKVALGVGAPYMVHVGSEDRWEIFIAGLPLLQLGSAEHEATIGATVVSAQLWEIVSAHAQGTKTAGGNFFIKSLNAKPTQPPRSEHAKVPDGVQDSISLYVPEPARSRIKQGIPRNLLADIRIVSVVFISLTNISTQDASMLDPLCSACSICVSALKHYRGAMRQFLQEDKGVTCIGVFGLPGQSGGDDATRAMKAALRIQQQLKGAGLQASIGVTTGKAYCGIIGSDERHEYAVVGPVVNLSARLMVAAAKYIGQDQPAILADAETYKLSQQYFKWQTPEPIFVKGKIDAVPIYRPLERAISEKIFLTKAARMVGRDEEYGQLKAALRAVQETGQGNLVVVEGDQGIGKSLLWERLARELDLPVGKGESKKMETNVPFAAISRLLSRLFQSNARPDSPVVCTTSYCESLLQGILEQMRPELIPLLSLLNAAFHLNYPLSREAAALEGPLKRQKLFELLSTFIKYVTSRPMKDGRPFMLVVEDAHDMDSSSWAFLRHHVGTQPMTNELWVVLHRPMTNPPEGYADMLKLARVRKLALKRLSDPQLIEVICSELSVRTLPPSVSSRVLPRAQGNPFFAAVLMQSLVESSACKVSNGVVVVNEASIATVSLSDQLERAVLSRIDRLGEVTSLLLRVCSVIGTEFLFALLVEIFPLSLDEAALIKELTVLEDCGLLSCERITMSGKPISFVFPQTVVQEVAYSTFAFGPRQEIHRKIAAWYRAQAERDGEEDPAHFPVMAQHYQRAGDLAMAAEYLRRTGDVNVRNYNNSEAICAYETALSLEKQKPGLLAKVHILYFHRVMFDLKWLSGKSFEVSNSNDITRVYQPFFDLANFRIPESYEELKKVLPGIRKQWIRNVYHHSERVGSASDEERPIFIELAKVAQKLYRIWILKARDAASADWCVFWQYHVIDWAERAHSPDLGYYYSFTCTLKRVVKSTNVLFHRVFPTYWAKWSLIEAAQHPQPEFMMLQTKLFNTMFSQPDWDLLTNGFEQALKLWREMKPEHLEYYRSSDSQISYEDSLATYGAGLLVIGNFRRTYEIGLELSQTMRGKSLRIFQEIAQRHMAMSLIFLRRYDEAEKLQILMEEQGTKNISDRAQMMWFIRYALLHAYRSEFDLALKYVKSAMPFIPTMTNVWFLGVYFFSLTYVLLKLWKHFCKLQSGKLLDISAPLSAEMRKESHGTILADLQNDMDQMRAKMWDVGYVWSALLPQVWLVQGEYFNMSLRRDKAINCYRRALCLAEKEGFIYARGKCHWVLGLTIADPAEAMLHLQKAVPIFETAGAGWEKAAVQEDLRQAEQALMSTIMF